MSTKTRVKSLSNALKWEAYTKKSPDWYPGKKAAMKRALKGQADSVKGHKTRKK